MILMFYV